MRNYFIYRSSLKHSNTTNGNQKQENIQDSMSGPVYADLVIRFQCHEYIYISVS